MRRVPVGAWVLLAFVLATLVSGGAVAALEPGADTGGVAVDGVADSDVAESDVSGSSDLTDRPVPTLQNRDGAVTTATNVDADSQTNDSDSVDSEAVAERRDAIVNGDRLVESCSIESPADYDPETAGNATDGDAIGWVDGYWYDQPVQIEDPASLDEQELDALVARTAARVEALRCLDFQSVPTVRIENASELSERQALVIENRSDAADRMDDARLESALLLATDVDPVDARVRTAGASVRGSYDPATNAITLVRPDDESSAANGTPPIDEPTLAHELVHALQDQHHDLSSFDAGRVDEAQAESALIEGDARVVEHRYEQRCSADQWTEACLTASSSAGDDGNVALSLLLSQPYNDGPTFVERAYSEGGWAAVDAYYDDPPNSAAEVLWPSEYDAYDPPFVWIDETIAPEWTRLRPDDAPATDVLGPSAISAALLAPTFEGHSDPIYDPESIRRNARESDHPYRSYDYRLDAVDGWAGDRLIAYENDRNETATLWASTWQSDDDATEFREHYEELLDARGARPVDGHWSTYRFSDGSDYDGAVYVEVDGTDVVIAHGPDVEALQSIYLGAAAEPRGNTASSSAEPRPSSELPADELPGLTIAGALLALLLVVAAASRWNRSS